MERLRVAVHEISHAIIAMLKGFEVEWVRLDGPPHKPGSLERCIPSDKPGNDTEWAIKELAVLSAGYEGEIVIYGGFEPEYQNSVDPEADWHMVDQCAIIATNIEDDIVALNVTQGSIARNRWRESLPQLKWPVYDALIETIEREVAETLDGHKDVILPLAELLYKERRLSGSRFEQQFAYMRNA